MATQVQWRGGSTAEHAAFTGAAREITVDTQKQTLVVHNGSTAGGEALLREDQANLPGSVTNGIYTPGTNQVAVSTGGTGRLFVDASGNVGIGTPNPQEELHIVAASQPYVRLESTGGIAGSAYFGYSSSTGSASMESSGSLRFAVPGKEAARIDTSGRLLVGTSSARSGGPYGTAGLQVESTSYSNASISAINNENTSDGVSLMLGKSRGSSIGSTTIVSSGDQVGGIYFQGADGSALRTAASIFAEIDGTPGSSDMPGRLVFSTTADGASSPTERMRIKSSGIINFSNAPVYADNAAALAGGLVAGDVYRKADGTLMITF